MNQFLSLLILFPIAIIFGISFFCKYVEDEKEIDVLSLTSPFLIFFFSWLSHPKKTLEKNPKSYRLSEMVVSEEVMDATKK